MYRIWVIKAKQILFWTSNLEGYSFHSNKATTLYLTTNSECYPLSLLSAKGDGHLRKFLQKSLSFLQFWSCSVSFWQMCFLADIIKHGWLIYIWKMHKRRYLRAIRQLDMRSRVFSEMVSGVVATADRTPDHKRSYSFTPNSQMCFQEGGLKQVQFLKYVNDLLWIVNNWVK